MLPVETSRDCDTEYGIVSVVKEQELLGLVLTLSVSEYLVYAIYSNAITCVYKNTDLYLVYMFIGCIDIKTDRTSLF